jgi:hypothetical protein
VADAIPSPLPKWTKTLLRVQEFLVPAFATQLVQYEGLIGHVLADASNEWRRFTISWHLSTQTDPADYAYTTFDLVNITGGLVDNTWTAGDYSAVTSAFGTALTTYSTNFLSSSAQVGGIKAYRMAFTQLPSSPPIPPDRDRPFAPTGPPDFQQALSSIGSAQGVVTPQVAFSTTDKTAYPRHWGRNYWPFPGAFTASNTDGQVSSAAVDLMATMIHTLYDTLQGLEFYPVVPITQMNKLPARALVTVDQIQVDSVLDVIRRRRPHTTRYRKVL